MEWGYFFLTIVKVCVLSRMYCVMYCSVLRNVLYLCYQLITKPNKMTLYKVNHGEEVVPTGKTRNFGHGWQIEVLYTDGSKGWEHFEDLHGNNGQFFGFIDGDEEKDPCWDFDGSSDTYESLEDAIDHYLIILND